MVLKKKIIKHRRWSLKTRQKFFSAHPTDHDNNYSNPVLFLLAKSNKNDTNAKENKNLLQFNGIPTAPYQENRPTPLSY